MLFSVSLSLFLYTNVNIVLLIPCCIYFTFLSINLSLSCFSYFFPHMVSHISTKSLIKTLNSTSCVCVLVFSTTLPAVWFLLMCFQLSDFHSNPTPQRLFLRLPCFAVEDWGLGYLCVCVFVWLGVCVYYLFLFFSFFSSFM